MTSANVLSPDEAAASIARHNRARVIASTLESLHGVEADIQWACRCYGASDSLRTHLLNRVADAIRDIKARV